MADHSSLINQLNELIETDKVLRVAASTTHNLMVQRIFTRGGAADGGRIGIYDKTPGYFSPSKSPRKFPTKGKKGDTKFANGKPHKTAYMQSGYFQFRAAAGRQNSFVDLTLTGTLRSSFVLKPGPGRYTSEFLNLKQAEIAEGNEKRFGETIFELTAAEQAAFAKAMEVPA